MTKLSNITSDYNSIGIYIDRVQYTALGGETTFDLKFQDESEEVYVDGIRKYRGASRDYVTVGESIVFTTPLTAGAEVLLIGRATGNDIAFAKAVSELVILSDGQLEVQFYSIETDGIELNVAGPLVSSVKLRHVADFELKDGTEDTIILTHSYPEGTTLEGIQGGRSDQVNPNTMKIYDGTTNSTLYDKFASINSGGTNTATFIANPKVGGGLLDLGVINEIQDGATYYLPAANSVPSGTVVQIAILDSFSSNSPDIQMTNGDTMLYSGGTDTSISLDYGAARLTVVSNGSNQWRI